MAVRLTKAASVLLLGFVLVGQGTFSVSTGSAAGARAGKQSCCDTGCGSQRCVTTACCVERGTPTAPDMPAPPPSSSQNEFHAVAPAVAATTVLPTRPASKLPAGLIASSPVTDIPLFQRNCSYLL